MNTHDEIRTLIEDIQAGSAGWERESAARLEALNEQCDKLLAVIDAAQAGVKALDAREYGGWIPWDDDGSPPTCRVTVRFRDGETGTHPATDMDWSHKNNDWDIVAYKVEGAK